MELCGGAMPRDQPREEGNHARDLHTVRAHCRAIACRVVLVPKWHTPAELTSSLQTWKVIAFAALERSTRFLTAKMIIQLDDV